MRTEMICLLPAGVMLDTRLTGAQIRILVAMYTFRDRNINTLWPGVEALARRAGVRVGSVQKALEGLEAAGWVACQPDGRFRLTVPEKFIVYYDEAGGR